MGEVGKKIVEEGSKHGDKGCREPCRVALKRSLSCHIGTPTDKKERAFEKEIESLGSVWPILVSFEETYLWGGVCAFRGGRLVSSSVATPFKGLFSLSKH